jgi:hypothetical protein
MLSWQIVAERRGPTAEQKRISCALNASWRVSVDHQWEASEQLSKGASW